MHISEFFNTIRKQPWLRKVATPPFPPLIVPVLVSVVIAPALETPAAPVPSVPWLSRACGACAPADQPISFALTGPLAK